MSEEKVIQEKLGVVLASKIEAIEDESVKSQEDLKQQDPDEATAKRIVYGAANLVYKK
jgi:hypothetical protein